MRNRRLAAKGVIESRQRATGSGLVDELMIGRTIVLIQVAPAKPKTEMLSELEVQQAQDLVVQVRSRMVKNLKCFEKAWFPVS